MDYVQNRDAELSAMVDFLQTANWRRRKSEEYSSDSRNLAAAERLELLAEQAESLNGQKIHLQLVELWKASDPEFFVDTVSEELRSVGFHSNPTRADDVLM